MVMLHVEATQVYAGKKLPQPGAGGVSAEED